MKDLVTALRALHRKGLDLWVDASQLRYRAAPGTLTPEDIGILRESKAEIIALLRDSSSLRTILDGPSSASRPARAPLSLQQESQWNARKTVNMVMTVSIKLVGDLNYSAFRDALTELTRRQGALRTRIVEIEGTPQLEMAAPSECALEITDLIQQFGSDAEAEARERVERFLSEEMDLERDPLLQYRLLKIAERAHVFALALHHMAGDGLSLEILFRELWTLYKDFIHGRASSLPDLPIQYLDYAVWQRQTYAFWKMKNEDYWHAAHARAKPNDYPIDAGLADVAPCTAAARSIQFDKLLSRKLLDLARSQHTIPAFLMLAIFVAILSQRRKANDIGLISIVSGRNYPVCDPLIGYFATPLCAYVEFSGNESFIEFLALVINEFNAAWEHLECGVLPGKEPRTEDRALPPPLFQWVPFVPGFHQLNPETAGLAVEPFAAKKMPGYYGKSFPAVELVLFDTADGIRGSATYRADLFTEDTVARFVNDYERLSEEIVRNPGARMDSLLSSLQ